jgi:hypothetical protein
VLVKDLSNSFNPVPKPLQNKKNAEKSAEIKKKSSKLAKAERNRFSILTENMEKCYFCNNKKHELHEVFRGRNRQKCMKWGLVVPICLKHHRQITDDKEFSKVLEEIARAKFIKLYGEEKFLEEFK